MAEDGTLKLLWDCATALAPETHTHKLLKSHYMTTCRKIAKNNVQMPKEKFAMAQMCPRCSCFWSENELELKLRPAQMASNGKARKLIAKLEEATATGKKLLNNKQKKRAKWLKKKVTSSMEILCDFCKHKSLVPLEKPKRKESIAEEVKVVAPVLEIPSKAKAKKKKNKTAGLKLEHCQNAISTKTKVKKQTEREKSVVALKPMLPPIQAIIGNARNTPTKTITKNTSNVNLTQTLKAKKKPKSKTKMAATVSPKIQSKTQQKNSLLQLAALLKTQATKSTTNSSLNRLESLLK